MVDTARLMEMRESKDGEQKRKRKLIKKSLLLCCFITSGELEIKQSESQYCSNLQILFMFKAQWKDVILANNSKLDVTKIRTQSHQEPLPIFNISDGYNSNIIYFWKIKRRGRWVHSAVCFLGGNPKLFQFDRRNPEQADKQDWMVFIRSFLGDILHFTFQGGCFVCSSSQVATSFNLNNAVEDIHYLCSKMNIFNFFSFLTLSEIGTALGS